MSIFSDHDCGAMDDFEFREECKRMDREERYFDDLDQSEEEEDLNER